MVNRYNSGIHHRRSIRLKGYDYSRAGAYFVTICTRNRECLFGEIVDGKMRVNEYGRVIRNEWMKTAEIRREIELGEFVVMPNHFHGIAVITDQPVRAYGHTPVRHTPVRHSPQHQMSAQNTPMRSPSKTLGAMVRGFKSAVTKNINTIRKTPGVPVWQRNYFEHIIRDDADYNRIAEYIAINAQRWTKDQLHLDNKPKQPGTIGFDNTDAGVTGQLMDEDIVGVDIVGIGATNVDTSDVKAPCVDIVDAGATNVRAAGVGADNADVKAKNLGGTGVGTRGGTNGVDAMDVGAYGHTPLRDTPPRNTRGYRNE